MWFDVNCVYLTAGLGVGGTPLNAFDQALRSASIADFNIIKVTSIVPPNTPVYKLESGRLPIRGEGVLVPAIYDSIVSNQLGTEIASAVGVGLPEIGNEGAGIAFVYSCNGTCADAEKVVAEMVREGMRAKGYKSERVELASASGLVDSPWTCVVSAAFFCDEHIKSLFEVERVS